MRITKKHVSNGMKGMLAGIAFSGTLHAQSSDALVDKLGQKGILTVKEANDLKEEADKGFDQAYQTKTGMPDWVSSMKFNGDFRGRFEQNNAENINYIDRNRYRFRVRFGITVSME